MHYEDSLVINTSKNHFQDLSHQAPAEEIKLKAEYSSEGAKDQIYS